MFYRLRFNRGNICVAHEFVTVARCGVETLLGIGAYLGLEFLGDSKDGGRLFFLPARILNIILKFDKAANLGMTE